MPARSARRALAAAIREKAGYAVEPGSFQQPPPDQPGQLALACFPLAKRTGRAPADIAKEIAGKLTGVPGLEAAQAAGPYVNLTLRTSWVVASALARTGVPEPARPDIVVIDFSSPNIAKHMAVYHLRSTMIGSSLCRIYRRLGMTVVGINHLGDWGTGFGKLIVAWRRWRTGTGGTSVTELNDLYVRFGREAKADPALEDEARAAFAALEKGDPGIRSLWRMFRDVSLAEFEKVYAMLGVAFDEVAGESVYEPMLGETLRMLRDKGLVEESEGALVVRLPGKEKPCLLQKGDGATLYATRDIAAALERQRKHGFTRALYVVDQGQSLHFEEWFSVLKRAGFAWADRLEHVPFGILRFGGKRGRTREGGVVLLKDVLDEAVARALEIIRKNTPDLPEPEKAAAAVGIGAVVFHDLKNQRTKDIDFDWEEILNFDGETGPYVQYAHVRACGILRKAAGPVYPSAGLSPLVLDEERALAWQVARFGEALERAGEKAEPSVVAGYLLDLAKAFHAYHYRVPVLKAEPAVTAARLRLIDAVRVTLADGLGVLGIQAPERM